MLRPGSLRTRSPLTSTGEPVPCVQCDRREVGLAWGEYCSVCRAERERRAARVSRRWGIVAAVGLAAYLVWRSPNELTPRIFAAASVLLVYVIVRRIVTRLLLEFMSGEDRKSPPTTPGGPP